VSAPARQRHELTPAAILRHAREITEEYEADNLRLTLRQMYYQFVSRGLCPSGQIHYKRIGQTLTDARYDGRFPVGGLEDRGREYFAGDFYRWDTSCGRTQQHAIGDWLRYIPSVVIGMDRWAAQDTYVTVLVEKEALAGVFEPTCNDLGVGWMACKGYPSVSALDALRKAALRAKDEGWARRAVVLYFGDHDPDGMEIPRSIERNIAKLQDVADSADGGTVPFEFRRLALNMAQIRQYDPPPFEAKVSSSRYQSYADEYGEDAWELDALEPRVLRRLVDEAVREYFDESVHESAEADMLRARQEALNLLKDPAFVARALDGT